ncbi:lipopolysaccharide biosynthesis protein [Ornithinimicrobium sp. CNJ-824]|uniref:lipopolysaccharide biosynthesis protein n=1 Tax=Ornithinimicrobium sp. CNJ-824 TaxID=1904966 RepID=UPI0022A94459|nr:oligosaccharide flippase family protein [Ornithinimicrobium sp. CNJ-824]
MWTGVHTLVSLPVAFVVNLLLARVLGAADYGRLALLTAILEVAGVVVGLGVGTAVLQFGAKAHARGDRNAVRALLSKSQGFRLLWTAPIVTGVVVLFANAPAGLLIAALLFGVWLPAATSGGPACLALENKADRGAQVAMVTNLFLQTAVVITVVTVATADAVWLVRLVVGGVSAAATLIFVSKDYRRAVLAPRLPIRFPSGFWKFALPTGASAIIGTLVASRTEVLFLDRLATAEQVGIFALAYGLSTHIFAPVQTLMNPLVPAISGLREVDAPTLGRALSRSLRVTSTVAGLMVASALPALALLVPLLYGAEFTEASGMFLALGAAAGLAVLGSPMRIFVLSQLRGGSLLWVDVAALVVAVTAMIFTIPIYGAWGAVLAKIASSATQLLLVSAVELRSGTLGVVQTFRAVGPSLIACVALGVAWTAGSLIGVHPLVGAIVAGFLGLTFFMGGLRVAKTGLTDADAVLVLTTLPRSLRRLVGPVLRSLTWSHEPELDNGYSP